jgi:hypothetical protein
VARVKRRAAVGLVALTAAISACSADASGCTAGGLDAITARSNLERRMEDAQQAGRVTAEQVSRARELLDTETAAAEDDGDWAGYCTAVDDTAAELGL